MTTSGTNGPPHTALRLICPCAARGVSRGVVVVVARRVHTNVWLKAKLLLKVQNDGAQRMYEVRNVT